jgi:hypothetical protein
MLIDRQLIELHEKQCEELAQLHVEQWGWQDSLTLLAAVTMAVGKLAQEILRLQKGTHGDVEKATKETVFVGALLLELRDVFHRKAGASSDLKGSAL